MIKSGIFPTMVTPFDESGNIDYNSLERFLDKFHKDGADGLFAVCQSSEMFNLSLQEKIDLASFVRKNSSLQVVASGHTQINIDDQVEVMKKIADTGVDAVVLISNAFAAKNEDDDIFIKNLDCFLTKFRDTIPFGIYECPFPYKRLLSEKILKYILSTNRFVFLKDTSCDLNIMDKRLSIIGDSPFGLYNANVETLAATTVKGAAGFSGVLANVTVKLVRCLMEYPLAESGIGKKAQILTEEFSEFLSNSYYPVSAKVFLKEMGIFKSINTRVKKPELFTESMHKEGKEFIARIKEFEIEYDKKSKM